MTISTDAQETRDKTGHLFVLETNDVEEMYMRKVTHDKPTAHHTLNGEKLEASPLRSRARRGHPLLARMCHSTGGAGHSARRERERERKGTGVGREVKMFLFADDMMSYLENLTEYTKKLPWLVWLSGLSDSLRIKGLPVRFSVRAHAWVSGQVPSRGRMRGNHTVMFRSLSFSFPSLSLNINK